MTHFASLLSLTLVLPVVLLVSVLLFVTNVTALPQALRNFLPLWAFQALTALGCSISEGI